MIPFRLNLTQRHQLFSRRISFRNDRTFWGLGLILLISGATTLKAEIRIGTVDMTRVLQESPSAKAKVDAIDKKATKAKDQINKQKQVLIDLQKKLGEDASGSS